MERPLRALGLFPYPKIGWISLLPTLGRWRPDILAIKDKDGVIFDAQVRAEGYDLDRLHDEKVDEYRLAPGLIDTIKEIHDLETLKCEAITFARRGQISPKCYKALRFESIRNLFGVQPGDYLVSLTDTPHEVLENPGASGSILFLTENKRFIMKTVQKKEKALLTELFQEYYNNLVQNPKTLLPKYFDCYPCKNRKITLSVMNNIFPTSIQLHQKFDLKGSTYKRKASKKETSKKFPTYKDLDFMKKHPEGIFLENKTYDTLLETMEKDCKLLESFKIIDYSLLLGVYFVRSNSSDLESNDANDFPSGATLAWTKNGDCLALYLGIIDILQKYNLKKKLEHWLKSVITDGKTLSVQKPQIYSERFLEFIKTKVFKKINPP
ncbi:hypothetical protein QYM36_012169 [Artemia franciscana]|uniref:PIPK domain-containing protein n=1 Tax=Artemia franciscana TaxID=6661 RepID=A0AA88KZN3_ARTSF|nr:hypothetical protein QYM36_012169 [Artemia franciscana]